MENANPGLPNYYEDDQLNRFVACSVNLFPDLNVKVWDFGTVRFYAHQRPYKLICPLEVLYSITHGGFDKVLIPMHFLYDQQNLRRNGADNHTKLLVINTAIRTVQSYDNIFNGQYTKGHSPVLKRRISTEAQDEALNTFFRLRLRRHCTQLGMEGQSHYKILQYIHYYTFQPDGCQLVACLVIKKIFDGERLPPALLGGLQENLTLLATWQERINEVKIRINESLSAN